jgi:hypothetical protein
LHDFVNTYSNVCVLVSTDMQAQHGLIGVVVVANANGISSVQPYSEGHIIKLQELPSGGVLSVPGRAPTGKQTFMAYPLNNHLSL